MHTKYNKKTIYFYQRPEILRFLVQRGCNILQNAQSSKERQTALELMQTNSPTENTSIPAISFQQLAKNSGNKSILKELKKAEAWFRKILQNPEASLDGV